MLSAGPGQRSVQPTPLAEHSDDTGDGDVMVTTPASESGSPSAHHPRGLHPGRLGQPLVDRSPEGAEGGDHQETELEVAQDDHDGRHVRVSEQQVDADEAHADDAGTVNRPAMPVS